MRAAWASWGEVALDLRSNWSQCWVVHGVTIAGTRGDTTTEVEKEDRETHKRFTFSEMVRPRSLKDSRRFGG